MNYTGEIIEVLAAELTVRKTMKESGITSEHRPDLGEWGMVALVKEFEHLVTDDNVVIPRNFSIYHDTAREQRAKYKQAQAKKRYYQKNKDKDA